MHTFSASEVPTSLTLLGSDFSIQYCCEWMHNVINVDAQCHQCVSTVWMPVCCAMCWLLSKPVSLIQLGLEEKLSIKKPCSKAQHTGYHRVQTNEPHSLAAELCVLFHQFNTFKYIKLSLTCLYFTYESLQLVASLCIPPSRLITCNVTQIYYKGTLTISFSKFDLVLCCIYLQLTPHIDHYPEG